jgi:hypothetical protein
MVKVKFVAYRVARIQPMVLLVASYDLYMQSKGQCAAPRGWRLAIYSYNMTIIRGCALVKGAKTQI